MKRAVVLSLALTISGLVNAGMNGLTWHSRANCGNNESITWDFLTTRELAIYSEHFLKSEYKHNAVTGWQRTWRNAAVHWGEAGLGAGWWVRATHMIRVNNQERNLAESEATDCSNYDGWWDVNK